MLLRFATKTLMTWFGNASAVEYNLYRGPLNLLGPSYSGDCLNRTQNTSYVDSQVPVAGQAFFYLVTMDVACGAGVQEGPMGDGTSGATSWLRSGSVAGEHADVARPVRAAA